jgi:hypothetical protein
MGQTCVPPFDVIRVEQGEGVNDTVLVTTRADVTLLFPHLAPQILIQRTGYRQSIGNGPGAT